MTDKAKLEKIKKLADAMYYAAFNLTTDASLLRKAMDEYHQFIIHEYCKEEPVSDEQVKEFTKNQHADKTCKENGNSLTQESVSESIDFEHELYKAFGQIKDFTLGIAIAKRFYDMGRKYNEPVSEDIEKEIDHAHKLFYEEVGWDSDEGARAYVADWFAYYFAKWQKEQMMAKAVDGEVGYWNLRGLSVNVELPHSVEEGDKVKVIVIKED